MSKTNEKAERTDSNTARPVSNNRQGSMEIINVCLPEKPLAIYASGEIPKISEVSVMEEDMVSIDQPPKGTANFSRALFMLLKAFVGTGVVFLPGSFVSGGLVFSICLMVFIAVLCLIAFQMLLVAQRHVGGSYGDVGKRFYGNWLFYIIQFFLCVSQMGFVASYFIFISQNIGIAVDTLSHCSSPIAEHYYIWIVLAVIIPATWVRKIGRLSWFAIFADILIVFGLICVLYYCSRQMAEHGVGPNIQPINSQDFALMIGTAVFSFEGIGMVIPIAEGMREPQKFSRVMTVGMVIVTSIFILIGTVGYLAFGDGTYASIVANLPKEPLSAAVQLLYSLAIILTSPFMLYPALTIIERSIFGPFRSGREYVKWKILKNVVRSLVAIVCAAVSFGVGPSGLDKFVSLVGSIACMPLCFIFPGMFHYKVAKNVWVRMLDILMILWGLGITIYTLYVNINAWTHPLQNSSRPTPPSCTP